jgi:hypothetical protein
MCRHLLATFPFGVARSGAINGHGSDEAGDGLPFGHRSVFGIKTGVGVNLQNAAAALRAEALTPALSRRRERKEVTLLFDHNGLGAGCSGKPNNPPSKSAGLR